MMGGKTPSDIGDVSRGGRCNINKLYCEQDSLIIITYLLSSFLLCNILSFSFFPKFCCQDVDS